MTENNRFAKYAEPQQKQNRFAKYGDKPVDKFEAMRQRNPQLYNRSYTPDEEKVIQAWSDRNERLARQPDATGVNYPDQMTKDFILRHRSMQDAVANDFAMPKNSDKMGRGVSALAGISDYGTFGFADEALGAISGLASGGHPFTEAGRERFGRNYAKTRDNMRYQTKKSGADNPYTHHGSGIATALPTLAAKPVQASAFLGKLPYASQVGNATTKLGQGLGKVGGTLTPQTVKNIGHNIANIPGVRATGRMIGNATGAMQRGAQTGAIWGGLTGAGNAEGGLDERAFGAGQGALVGGVVGAALGPVVEGLGFVGGSIFEKIGRSADEKAVRATLRRMNADGSTPEKIVRDVFEIEGSPGMVKMVDDMQAQGASSDDIFNAVRDAVSKGKARGQEPVNETVAEMAGPKTRGLAQATANVGARGGDAAEAVVRRGQALSSDLESSMSRALKQDSDDFYAKRKQLADQRATGGAADYESAYGTEAPVDVFNRALFDPIEVTRPGQISTPVVQRPRFQEKVESVSEMARKDGDLDLAHELEGFLKTVRSGKRPDKALSTRAIDEIDRAIGEAKDIAMNAGERRAAGRLGDIQRALRATDEATGLGTARANAKVRIDASEAPDMGRKAWKRGVDAEEIAETLEGAPQEVFDGYMTGVARGMADELRAQRTLGGMADSASKIAGTQQMRDKLKAVLPTRKNGKLTTQSERFLQRIERTRDMAEFSRQTFGGSRTTPLSEAIKDATESEGLVAALSDMVEGGARNGGLGKLRQTAGNLFSRPGVYDDEINEAIGNTLFATGRDGIIDAMERLAKEGSRNGGLIGLGGRGAAHSSRVAGIAKGGEASRNFEYAQDFNNAYANDYRAKDELAVILMESGQASNDDFMYYAEMLQDVPPEYREDALEYLMLQQERQFGRSEAESSRPAGQ